MNWFTFDSASMNVVGMSLVMGFCLLIGGILCTKGNFSSIKGAFAEVLGCLLLVYGGFLLYYISMAPDAHKQQYDKLHKTPPEVIQYVLADQPNVYEFNKDTGVVKWKAVEGAQWFVVKFTKTGTYFEKDQLIAKGTDTELQHEDLKGKKEVIVWYSMKGGPSAPITVKAKP